MNKILFVAALFITLLFPLLSSAEDWEYFMQNSKGDNYYIDLDSIKHEPSGTVTLQRKVEPRDSSSFTSRVCNVEMDCNKERIRVLKETYFDANGQSNIKDKEGQWQNVANEDIEELMLELICSLKRAQK